MNWGLILLAVMAVGTAAGSGYYKGRESGMAEVQQQWDAEKRQLAAEHARNVAAAREKEQALQADADRLRQEKDREIKNLNARATALANSLRNRPERPSAGSSVSSTASAGLPAAGCTGAELSRQDAEFLAREAARADELRAALKQCQAQYQAIRN